MRRNQQHQATSSNNKQQQEQTSIGSGHRELLKSFLIRLQFLTGIHSQKKHKERRGEREEMKKNL